MRRIVYGILGLLGILLGGLLVVPFFINVNDYKPQIIAKAKENLGRDVDLGGKISLHIIPYPQLSLEQVNVSNIPGGKSKDFIRIKRVDVAIDLLPLFRKQIKIKSIELNQPEIFLEKLPDGTGNWSFSKQTTSESPSSVEAAAPSSTSGSESAPEVALDKLLIHNGRLTYHDKGKDVIIDNINVMSKMDSLKGPYSLVGHINALGRTIELETKIGVLGDTQDVNVNIGMGGSSLNLVGKASLASLSFQGALKGIADPKTFQTETTKTTDKEKTSPLLSKPIPVEGTILADANGFELKDATIDIGSTKPIAALKVTFKDALRIQGSLENIPGEGQSTFSITPSDQGIGGTINASVSQPKSLLSWLEIDTKSLPPEALASLVVSTDFNLGQGVSFKNLNLSIQDAKLQGSFSWQTQKGQHQNGQPQQAGPLLHVDLTSPKIENVLKILGAKKPRNFGLGKLQGTIQYNPTSLNLIHMKGQLGSVLSFAGDVAVNHGGAKPQINANLSLNSINVNTILASHLGKSPLHPKAKVFLISRKSSSAQSQSGHSRWSTEPLDLSVLNKFDGTFNLNADQLNYKEISISHPKISTTVKNGMLSISSMTGSIFGGSLVAMGHLSSKNTIKAHLTLKDANLKNLSPQGSSVKIVAGKLFFSSDLTTHGQSIHGLIQNLSGPVRISAKDGIINGFNLHAVSQGIGSLQNPANLLGLLNSSMTKGQTPFSSFKGELAFNQGVGTIQSMNLEAQGGRGHATGQIDLPRYVLNIHTEFRLTDHPKLPPFQMHLSGRLDNPSRKLDTANLQQYMIENVFKGVIENLGKGKLDARNVLGSILGGGNASPQQPQQGSPQPQKPEQVVKEIFKGLF